MVWAGQEISRLHLEAVQPNPENSGSENIGITWMLDSQIMSNN